MPLLRDARAVLLGSQPVDAAYARGEKVWPAGPPAGPQTPYWDMATFGQPALTQQADTFPVSGWSYAWQGSNLRITVPDTGGLASAWGGPLYPAAVSLHPYTEPIPETLGMFAQWSISWSGALGGDLLVYVEWLQTPASQDKSGGIAWLENAASSDVAVFLPWTLIQPATEPPAFGSVIPAGYWRVTVVITGQPTAGVATISTTQTRFAHGNPTAGVRTPRVPDLAAALRKAAA